MEMLRKYIVNGNLSSAKKLLINKLITIWNDNEFILGILCNLENDSEVNEMLDFMDENKKVEPWELTLKALYIDRYRNDKKSVYLDDFYGEIKALKNEIEKKKETD